MERGFRSKERKEKVVKKKQRLEDRESLAIIYSKLSSIIENILKNSSVSLKVLPSPQGIYVDIQKDEADKIRRHIYNGLWELIVKRPEVFADIIQYINEKSDVKINLNALGISNAPDRITLLSPEGDEVMSLIFQPTLFPVVIKPEIYVYKIEKKIEKK